VWAGVASRDSNLGTGLDTRAQDPWTTADIVTNQEGYPGPGKCPSTAALLSLERSLRLEPDSFAQGAVPAVLRSRQASWMERLWGAQAYGEPPTPSTVPKDASLAARAKEDVLYRVVKGWLVPCDTKCHRRPFNGQVWFER
jgi:hypothetical protein